MFCFHNGIKSCTKNNIFLSILSSFPNTNIWTSLNQDALTWNANWTYEVIFREIEQNVVKKNQQISVNGVWKLILSWFPKNISGCLYFLFINSLYFDQFHRTQNLSFCFSNKCFVISESLDICAGKQDKILRKNATFAVWSEDTVISIF